MANASALLLENVETAIGKVMGMQSYRLGDRTVTYADLKELRALRAELQAEVQQAQGTRPSVSYMKVGANFE